MPGLRRRETKELALPRNLLRGITLFCHSRHEGKSMAEDRDKPAARQVKGSVKEAIGKLTGDAKAESEGAAEKTAGEVGDTAGAEGDVRNRLKR